MVNKKILAIETSGELCSVAVTLGSDTFDERSVCIKHVHSERLVPMIDEILSANELTVGDLDCVAVSSGPGSFTGLRIGMTAAKAIAFSEGIPIATIPTFDALAMQINDYLPENQQFCLVNNANMEECYFGKYKSKKSKEETIVEVRLLEKAKLDEYLEQNDIIFGNVKAISGIKKISSPRASYVAKWTYLFGEDLLTFDYDYLEPNYLKKFKVKQRK